MNMRKLLFILMVALPAISYGQRCFTKIDEFTGKKIKTGMVSLIPFSVGPPIISLSKNDTSTYIGFVFETSLKASNFIADKMLLMLKFENGTIKIYHADSKTNVSETAQGVIVGFESVLPSADLYYIKDFPISLIRFSYKGDQDSGYDSKISKGKAKDIIEVVSCVIN
jgi:hypothetical protein